jgi:hypothetical protein
MGSVRQHSGPLVLLGYAAAFDYNDVVVQSVTVGAPGTQGGSASQTGELGADIGGNFRRAKGEDLQIIGGGERSGLGSFPYSPGGDQIGIVAHSATASMVGIGQSRRRLAVRRMLLTPLRASAIVELHISGRLPYKLTETVTPLQPGAALALARPGCHATSRSFRTDADRAAA